MLHVVVVANDDDDGGGGGGGGGVPPSLFVFVDVGGTRHDGKRRSSSIVRPLPWRVRENSSRSKRFSYDSSSARKARRAAAASAELVAAVR